MVIRFNLTGGTHRSKIGVVLGSVGGVIGFLTMGILFLIWKRNRKHFKHEIFVDVPGSLTFIHYFDCMTGMFCVA